MGQWGKGGRDAVTCDTSQVLLAGGQVFFLGDLLFSPHLTSHLAQNECNDRKTAPPTKKKEGAV